MYKHNKKVSIFLVIVILAQLLLMPQMAQAQQLAALPPQATAVVTGGERFMDAVPAAMEHALKLGQLLEYIAQADPNTLPESTLADARNHALEAAQYAAVAQGAVGMIANGIDELDPQIQAAADIDALVATLDSDGFSAEMETVLSDAGLSAAQISDLETNTVSAFQTRRVISQTGFVTETVAHLLAGGLTPAQITQVEDKYATYGLADVTLADKLAQLRAGQDEMTLMRAETLQAYTQLLSHQVFLRYQNGQTGRAATAEEIEALIQDQLRLLTHIGYLNELTGSGAVDPEVGEGQWLFIERYSQQAAERLETLILETQNVGLVVDLFILRQIHTTSLMAQSGDPVFAKSELDFADDVLANLLGDSLPGAQAALQAEPPFLWRVGLALSEWIGKDLLAWEAMPEPEIKAEAVAVSKELVDGRMSRLGVPAALLPLASGDIQELDETNNVDWLHFYSALPTDQPPGLIGILEQVIPGLHSILDFVWGALTGQSDNPFAIGANIILSFVPVLGELLDLIAIFTEPTTWGKVMALIGLLASILSDGAAILTMIGAAIPPTLAATVPGTLLLEAIDIGAAILKPINRFVGTQVASIIDRIPFDRVLRLGGDVLTRLARNAVNSVGGANGWPHSIEAAISLVQGLVRSVVDPFSALLTRFSNNLTKLYDLGFGDGGYLVGRVLHATDDVASLSDEALEAVGRYGDEAGEALSELSDDALEGLGEVADDAGENGIRSLDEGLSCVVGLVSQAKNSYLGKRTTTLFLPTNNDEEQCRQLRDLAYRLVGQAAQNWSDETLEGLGRIVDQVGEGAAQRLIDLGNNVSEQALGLVGRKGTVVWDNDTVEGLAQVFESPRLPRVTVEDVASSIGTFSDTVIEDSLRFINQSDILNRTDDARDVFQWRSGNSLNTLDANDVTLGRIDLTVADYNAPGGLSETIQNRWGNLNNNPDRLAEALAVEGAVKQLRDRGYQEIYVLTTEGAQGPDAIMRAQNGTWVIVEGKGTHSGLPLVGSIVENTQWGRQLSANWITADDGARYLDHIADPAARQQVEEMIEHIQNGGAYQVVVGRGGFGAQPGVTPAVPRPLDYGGGLDSLITAIKPPASGWTIDFLFTRIP